MNTTNYKFHITYDVNMTLKELSDLLCAINLSINDYYRDNGVGNAKISLYAPVVNEVDKGSIVLDLAVSVFSGLTSTLLTEYILNRIKNVRKFNVERTKDLNNVRVECGNNNTINIHISN